MTIESKPFDFGGYIWATNGHILVRAGGQDGAVFRFDGGAGLLMPSRFMDRNALRLYSEEEAA